MLGRSVLPVCKKCAQHVEDRGFPASLLHDVCGDCGHGLYFHHARPSMCWAPVNMGELCKCGGRD